MAATAEIVVKKLKELEENSTKPEEVTERPSSKTYSFSGELVGTYTEKDAIDNGELTPLFSKEKIGPKKK